MPGYKKPMMGHKKPKMGHKPKMAHGKKPTKKDLEKLGKPVPKGGVPGGRKYGNKPKMAHGKKPQFNAKLKEAAKSGKLDDNPKFKAAVEKAKPKMYHKKPKKAHKEKERRHPETGKVMKKMDHIPDSNKKKITKNSKPKPAKKPEMYNKKPFMMKPGSKQVNSPSSFKSNEPAMMFKNNMPKDHRAGHPKDKEREKQRETELDKDYEAIGSKGDVEAYAKRLRLPGRSNLDLPAINDKAVTKTLEEFPELKPPTTQGDSIRLTKFQLKGGISPSTYNKFQGGPSKAEKRRDMSEKYEARRQKKIDELRAKKAKMYGNKPKMYFGKKK